MGLISGRSRSPTATEKFANVSASYFPRPDGPQNLPHAGFSEAMVPVCDWTGLPLPCNDHDKAAPATRARKIALPLALAWREATNASVTLSGLRAR